MERRAPVAEASLSKQVTARLEKVPEKKPEYDGSDRVVSTGSTLLDLAISGSRFERGGIPGGILVEVFGPSGCGKTVMLCEIAGAVQRQGGAILFNDPEARLNKQFASMFGFEMDNKVKYERPDTVKELFAPIHEWEPKAPKGALNAVFADSLAALSTEMEMEDEDKMGMKRAKDFSEQCRKVCRVLTDRNILMVCSNQVRQNLDAAGPYSEKYTTPGGQAIPFYASLRLRCYSPQKITREKTVGAKKQKRVVGVQTKVQVYKSSVDVPYREADVYILFDYGIDDIRGNLVYLKDVTKATRYVLGDQILGQSIDDAVRKVEETGLEEKLKDKVIEYWRGAEELFKVDRLPKRR